MNEFGGFRAESDILFAQLAGKLIMLCVLSNSDRYYVHIVTHLPGQPAFFTS